MIYSTQFIFNQLLTSRSSAAACGWTRRARDVDDVMCDMHKPKSTMYYPVTHSQAFDRNNIRGILPFLSPSSETQIAISAVQYSKPLKLYSRDVIVFVVGVIVRRRVRTTKSIDGAAPISSVLESAYCTYMVHLLGLLARHDMTTPGGILSYMAYDF